MRDDLSRFAMPCVTLEILGQSMGVSVGEYPLTLPYLGGNPIETLDTVEASYDDLAEGGLVRNGQLVPEVSQAIELLGRAPISAGVMAIDEKGHWQARAVCDSKNALLVEQIDEDAEFTWLPIEDWPLRLAGMLPPMRPAPGGPVATTATGKDYEQDEDQSGRSMLVDSGPVPGRRKTTSTMDDVEKVFAAERTGSGHFAVTGTDPLGKPVTAPALSWIDTELGAYATTTHARHGRNRVTFTPVDNNELGELLRARIDSVRA